MFTLECFKENFVNDIAEYANNINVAKYLRNAFPYPYTVSDAEDYIKMCIENNNNRQICRAIVVDGKAVGSIGIFLQDDVYSKSAELGYWLAEDFWNKGIMTKAVKQLCEIAFEMFDIVRIYAEPFSVNKGSRRVLEKCGFKYEGTLIKNVYKNGEYLDSCIYALIKQI